jgi:glycosyltransferase involved in cell wall biosynthesis
MDDSIKVLLLVENNGYPRDFRVRREAEALRDAGYRVSVICPREGGEPWTECHAGIDVYRFPAPPGGRGALSYALEFGYATLAMLVLALWVALRRGVDVVHAANPPDTLFVIGAAFRLLGKRFVFDHHDLAPEVYLSRFERARPGLVHACLRLMERCSYAVADVVIATNESYRRRAIETGGKRPDKVFVVRNGPPLSYQSLAPPGELAPPGSYLIGYVGTIGPQDGVDRLMRAVDHIVHSLGRDDVHAIVIGDGDALAQVRRLAAALRIERHLSFTGWLPEREARRCLSAAHVCVQPDPSGPLNDKSTMNKLMEYMALGKPTVAFDLEETRYSAQEAAVYVPSNDERRFAETIVWLLDNPQLRQRMGEFGRRRVRAALAWEYSVPELLRAYDVGLGLRSEPFDRAAPRVEGTRGEKTGVAPGPLGAGSGGRHE